MFERLYVMVMVCSGIPTLQSWCRKIAAHFRLAWGTYGKSHQAELHEGTMSLAGKQALLLIMAQTQKGNTTPLFKRTRQAGEMLRGLRFESLAPTWWLITICNGI